MACSYQLNLRKFIGPDENFKFSKFSGARKKHKNYSFQKSESLKP